MFALVFVLFFLCCFTNNTQLRVYLDWKKEKKEGVGLCICIFFVSEMRRDVCLPVWVKLCKKLGWVRLVVRWRVVVCGVVA